MKSTLTTFALLLLALTSCKTTAQVGAYTASIEGPASVNRGEKLTFRVTLKDNAGAVAAGVVYQWKVSWDGVEGIYHKGKSGEEQKINVKGAPGPASIHVYAYDANGTLAEIAKHEFKVE